MLSRYKIKYWFRRLTGLCVYCGRPREIHKDCIHCNGPRKHLYACHWCNKYWNLGSNYGMPREKLLEILDA